MKNANKSKLVRKAPNSGSEKEIHYTTYCSGSKKDEIPEDDLKDIGVPANQIHRSKSCSFAIAIKSNNEHDTNAPQKATPGFASATNEPKNDQLAHYELSIEESNTDHLLNEKHPSLLRLLPQQRRYYK